MKRAIAGDLSFHHVCRYIDTRCRIIKFLEHKLFKNDARILQSLSQSPRYPYPAVGTDNKDLWDKLRMSGGTLYLRGPCCPFTAGAG